MPGVVLDAGAPSGPALGLMPSDMPLVPNEHIPAVVDGQLVGVKPKSPPPKKKGEPKPIGDPEKITGSALGVISMGTVISKIACGCGEAGDAPKVTAQFTPIAAGLSDCTVPVPAKSPTIVLAPHDAPPAPKFLNCSVVGTARSVIPSWFSTANGSETLAMTCPAGKVLLVRAGSS